MDVTTGRVWQSNQTGEFRTAELPPIQSQATAKSLPQDA
jgi:hypothetical protein